MKKPVMFINPLVTEIFRDLLARLFGSSTRECLYHSDCPLPEICCGATDYHAGVCCSAPPAWRLCEIPVHVLMP